MSREKITDVNIICFNPFDKAKMKLLLTKLLPNNKQQQQQLQQQQLDQTNLLPKKKTNQQKIAFAIILSTRFFRFQPIPKRKK